MIHFIVQKGKKIRSKTKNNYFVESQNLPCGGTIKYKCDICQDPVIDKKKDIRDSKLKNAGKSLPRRAETTKSINDEDVCGFKLLLYLKEGKHWNIPYQLKDRKYHNHMMLNKNEM